MGGNVEIILTIPHLAWYAELDLCVFLGVNTSVRTLVSSNCVCILIC